MAGSSAGTTERTGDMKKFFIALIGGTVLLLGIALLVLPGPGVPIVAAGLAILATEFFWARRAMRKAKGAVARLRRKSGFRGWRRRRCVTPADNP
jgi:hypothetical protein